MSNDVTWRDNALLCVHRFSQAVEDQFRVQLNAARTLLPPFKTKEENEANIRETLDLFFEYFVGTMVAILCQYVSDEKQLEENMIALMRDKFERLRVMKKEGALK